MSTFQRPQTEAAETGTCVSPRYQPWARLGPAHIDGSEVVYLSDLDFLNWSALSALCPQDVSILTEGQT